jgi:hypothetical protein
MGALVRTVTPVSNTMAATVTSLLAKQLEHDPSATYAILPGQDDDVEPVKVSFQDFALATRRFARLIQPTTQTSGAGPIPGSSKTGVIGLLIHCDTLLYATALSGVIAAGYTVRSSPNVLVTTSLTFPSAGLSYISSQLSCRRSPSTPISVGPPASRHIDPPSHARGRGESTLPFSMH